MDTSYNVSIALGTNNWNHVAFTYNGTTTASTYVNGTLIQAFSTPQLNVDDSTFELGAGQGSFIFEGHMSDFRAYDAALSASEISDLFTAGPNPPPLSVTMYTHIADFAWSTFTGATTYRLTSKKDAGTENTLINTTDLTYSLFNLTQGSSYEFNLYTDLDLVTPVDTSTVSPLTVDATNVDAWMVRIGNYLNLLNSVCIDDISKFVSQVLTTGEIVNTSIGATRLVEDAGTITLLQKSESVLTPFDPLSGPGQTASVTLPDLSTILVEFDETNEDVTIDSITTYSVGDSFVAGGFKVTLIEI